MALVEQRAKFGLRCMQAALLVMGHHVRYTAPGIFDTITNTGLIALNQVASSVLVANRVT